jgi:uncharacterized Tic20 family protein
MTNNSVPTPPNASGSSAGEPLSPSDEKLWATLIHIGGIFISFVAPLIGYIVLKDRGSFVSAHAKTALNFQISFGIYSIAIGILSAVTFGIASFLYVPLGIVVVIFSIIAAVAANKGELYSYPMTITFIK